MKSKKNSKIEAKCKRLKSKGWRIGSVSDFLDLSDEENKNVERELEYRKRRGWTRLFSMRKVHRAEKV